MKLVQFEQLVIAGILAMFMESERVGVHKVDESYVHSCIDMVKDEHGEWDVASPEHFEYSLQCAWEDDRGVDEAIEYFGSGVVSIYRAHMSAI